MKYKIPRPWFCYEDDGMICDDCILACGKHNLSCLQNKNVDFKWI